MRNLAVSLLAILSTLPAFAGARVLTLTLPDVAVRVVGSDGLPIAGVEVQLVANGWVTRTAHHPFPNCLFVHDCFVRKAQLSGRFMDLQLASDATGVALFRAPVMSTLTPAFSWSPYLMITTNGRATSFEYSSPITSSRQYVCLAAPLAHFTCPPDVMGGTDAIVAAAQQPFTCGSQLTADDYNRLVVRDVQRCRYVVSQFEERYHEPYPALPIYPSPF